MFSHCYQSGNSIELFNSADKNLLSKWHFIGKHNKIFDPQIKCYEHILATGALSKMEIPGNRSYSYKFNPNKSLALFQSFIVFQIYLFSNKQFSIEISISDTTKVKRRLIFSSNNSDVIINQLHCRIPIINFPIGKWINFSVDILSFVSECFKDLTFRSVDYISLSMSGKVRYIFTMRTPLIETHSEIEDNENILGDIDNEDNKNELDGIRQYESISNVISNNNDLYGATDIPDKFKFPPREISYNINMNCNRVMTQIFIENEIHQIRSMRENQMNQMYDNYNSNYNRNNYQSKKNIKNNKSNNNINNNNYNNNYINNNNNNNINSRYGNQQIDYNEYNPNKNSYNSNNLDYLNPSYYTFGRGKNQLIKSGSTENNRTGRFNNIGSLIINGESKGGNQELYNEREFVDVSYPQKNESKNQIKFDKEEYNKLSLDGKSVTNSIKKSLNIFNNNRNINNNNNNNYNNNNNNYNNNNNNNNSTSLNNQSNTSKGNLITNNNSVNNNLQNNINLSNFYIHNEEGNLHYQLSTIKNDNANNSEDLNEINEDKKILIGAILEDSMNALNNNINNLNTEDLAKDFVKDDDDRPFSPPLTKLEEIKNN